MKSQQRGMHTHSSMTGERVQLNDRRLGIPMSQQATKASLAGEEENLLAEGAMSCPLWTSNNSFSDHYRILTYSGKLAYQNRWIDAGIFLPL